MAAKVDGHAITEKLLSAKADAAVPSTEGNQRRWKQLSRKQRCGGYAGACIVIVFVLVWLLQAFLYFIATTAWGCRAGALENYNYLNNQADKSDKHDEAYNVMPLNSYLTQQDRTWYGQNFAVQPIVANSLGNSGGGALASASVGNWWLAWGPVFNTYVYEDLVDSQSLLWMRRSMLRLGQSHRVGRCDGKGPLIEFEEGMNWWSNLWKNFFGVSQALSLKVFVDYNDDKGRQWLATIEEQNEGIPSTTLVYSKNDITSVVADSTLHNQREADQGRHAQWYVRNKVENPFPYYLLSAVTLLYAFHYKGTVNAGLQPQILDMAQSYLRNSTAVFQTSPQIHS